MTSCLFVVFRREFFISHRLEIFIYDLVMPSEFSLGITNNISIDVLFDVAISETESLDFYASNRLKALK